MDKRVIYIILIVPKPATIQYRITEESSEVGSIGILVEGLEVMVIEVFAVTQFGDVFHDVLVLSEHLFWKAVIAVGEVILQSNGGVLVTRCSVPLSKMSPKETYYFLDVLGCLLLVATTRWSTTFLQVLSL